MARQDDARTALDSLEVAREAYERFQEAWHEVGRITRHLDDWQWHRVEAYPGWDGRRDVGAGVDMEGWMTEVQERLDDIASEDNAPECDGFAGENAWGECSKCGRKLEEHAA